MTPKVKYKKNGDWNELDLSSGESGSNVSIDDTNTSVDKTWSSDKINKQLKTIANEMKNIGGYGYKVYNVLNYDISTENEDNTPALQTLVDTVNANGGGIIFFPVGTYKFKSASTNGSHVYAILLKSNVSIIGENIEKTIFKQTEGIPYTLFYSIGTANLPLSGCSYSNFTVDAYSTGDTNKVWGKVFFGQYLRNCVYRDIILKGTVATALGIDFLDNVEINNVHCIDCGRTFKSTETGTSAIGIGTGGWENENFQVTNCICIGSGQYGIFIENQKAMGWGGNTLWTKGCVIANNIVRNGLNKGIGVRGGVNVIVANNSVYENKYDGIYLDRYCKNIKLSNNIINDSGNYGIHLNCAVGSENIEIDSNNINTQHLHGIMVSGEDKKDIVIKNNIIQYSNLYNAIQVESNINGLFIKNNITKNNRNYGLNFASYKIVDAVIKDNVFTEGTNSSNATFVGNVQNNELIIEGTNTSPTSITADDITCNLGEKPIIAYNVLPDTASQDVLFNSIDVNIATVDMRGRITLKTTGTGGIKITSREDSNITKTISLTVGEETTINHTVTNNLTNCTNNNNTTSVTNGSSYNATITANTGYTLNSITITMGGTDITSSVYSNGIINIENVTSNIIITAIATNSEDTPTTGIITDSKLDNNGNVVEGNGYTVSDFRDISSMQNYYVDFTVDSLPSSGVRIALYDTDKNFISYKSLEVNKPYVAGEETCYRVLITSDVAYYRYHCMSFDTTTITVENTLLTELDIVTSVTAYASIEGKIMSDGSLGEQSGTFIPDYVNVNNLKSKLLKATVNDESTNGRIALYDSDKNVISVSNTTYNFANIRLTHNTTYIRLFPTGATSFTSQNAEIIITSI